MPRHHTQTVTCKHKKNKIMNKLIFFLTLILLSNSTFSQVIVKPMGCFAGTNGTNPAVLSHADVRGVLLSYKWHEIEVTPGNFDFTNLNNDISNITNVGLKYTIAILGGGVGSPDWLIDSLGANYFSFVFQNQNMRLPLWWDTIVQDRLDNLITELGNQYAQDNMLSHVYVTQMTVNGVEGHLNGIDMSLFAASGFTNQNWINSAKSTVNAFANAFPDKPIVFEVHEIDHDTIVPSTIINDLFNDPALCERVGLGMWWISGKTTYQPNLIDFISNFQGDKYAQIIGRSDQTHRFKDSLYSTVFLQAKNLGIRYLEPWPYEFQHHTHDSLIQDFNMWTDANFLPTDTCSYLTTTTNPTLLNNKLIIYPIPTNGSLNIKIDFPYKELKITIFNLNGQKILTATNRTELDISHFPKGLYFIKLKIDNKIIDKKFIKAE
jgi:hypothetical protein